MFTAFLLMFLGQGLIGFVFGCMYSAAQKSNSFSTKDKQ